MVFGREDCCFKHSSPSASKACSVFRTVWVAQPRLRAISEGRCPRREANRIWLRRRVKAFGERSPASSPACSAGLTAGMYIGAFMPPLYHLFSFLHNRSLELALATQMFLLKHLPLAVTQRSVHVLAMLITLHGYDV